MSSARSSDPDTVTSDFAVDGDAATPDTAGTTTPRPGTSAGGARAAYTTLSAPHSLTLEVKKSKFVATAWPVASTEGALKLISGAGDPAASHNCWALVAGASSRCTDDGEPAGTAGRPILGAIQAEHLDGVAVLVTRFFGGTKLGTGGLVRAYGAAARDCLRAAQRVTVQPASRVWLRAPLADVGSIYECLAGAGGARAGEESYGRGGGEVVLQATVPRAALGGLVAALASKTAGRAECVVEEE
jgi:putative IMPACT (imprinted ancient) family translation regulator